MDVEDEELTAEGKLSQGIGNSLYFEKIVCGIRRMRALVDGRPQRNDECNG